MNTLAVKNSVNEPLTGGHKAANPVQTPVSSLASLPAAVPLIQRKPLCACDGGCPRCSGVIQPKLTIGQPNDEYEEEADQVADQVMRMPEPKGSLVNGQSSLVQRKTGCSSCGERDEEEPIQTKPIGDRITPLVQRQVDEEEEEVQPKLNGNDKVQRQVDEEPDEEEEEPAQLKALSNKSPPSPDGPGLQASVQSLKGGGKPLSAASRAFFEPRFGRDFSNVRVHTGAKATDAANAVNARAFTLGKDIVFNAGQYFPHTSTGKRLMAHELTHVLQQSGSKGSANRIKRQSDSQVYEPSVSTPTFIQRQQSLAVAGFPEGCIIEKAEVKPRRHLKYPYSVVISYKVGEKAGEYHFFLVKKSQCSDRDSEPAGYLLGIQDIGTYTTGFSTFTATASAIRKYPYVMMYNATDKTTYCCKKWAR